MPAARRYSGVDDVTFVSKKFVPIVTAAVVPLREFLVNWKFPLSMHDGLSLSEVSECVGIRSSIDVAELKNLTSLLSDGR